ncbi:MAG: ABC transporter ATP-binding protein [Rhodocyclales bacterium]|nr:ABC transporter ATP-binding protein [Rhodocyclales bacterium]
MSHHLVAARDLGYVYPDGHPALDGINFTIRHGESVAIIGGNGAGKSTLLLHLNGVLTPSQGEVRIGDFPITRENLAAVRRTVGMIFQDADDQLFMPTVFDDVAFGLAHQGLALADVEARVMRALETVGAAHLRSRPPYRLSGGEKRAVAIAGVLVMEPNILVMDEPSSGLDPAARRRLIKLLAGFAHTRIVATHDLDMVLDLCQRVLVMHQGRIAADGLPADIFADAELLHRCNLEPPLSYGRQR